MSRLFYPILFTLTVALAARLWARHGLPTQWLTVLDAAVAQAQSPLDAEPAPPFGGGQRSGAGGTAVAPTGDPTAPRGGGPAPPPPNAAANGRAPATQRLPSTAQGGAAAPAHMMSRARQAPYTQLRLEGGPEGLRITPPTPIPSAKVVARVGSEVILAADVLPEANEEFQKVARQIPPEQQAPYFTMLMANLVRQLVQRKLVVRASRENIPDDKFPEMKKQVLSHFPELALPSLLKQYKVKTEAELDAKLKEHGGSLAKEKDKFIEQALISEWMRNKIKFDEHVTHDELLKYYHQHLAEYEFKAKARFEEIRVGYGKKRSKQDAWLVIRGLADRVYAGASMTELAKAHSDSVKAETGGQHDWTNEGSLACKEIDLAVFNLPVGALSNIIDDEKTRASVDEKNKVGAFVLVRVVERKLAGVTSFEEAQGGIRETIKGQRRQVAQQKTLTEFMEKNKFRHWTIYDDMFREAEEKQKKMAQKASPVANRIR